MCVCSRDSGERIVTYKLLITGSRKANTRMEKMALDAVLRAKANGWSIIVGDATGVDYWVQVDCCWNNVPFEVFGITQYPRNICCEKHISCYTQVDGSFLDRDALMVGLADRVFAIWNGRSRGTKFTYDCAVHRGVPADIRTVGD
jgi:hypothetical protein